MGRGTGIAGKANEPVAGTRIRVFEHPLDGMRRNGAELLTVADAKRLPGLPDRDLAHKSNMGVIAEIKLEGPGRSRIYVTALDTREHVIYGYVVSGRGPEHDRWDWLPLEELASRTGADGNPTISRVTGFAAKPVDEALAEVKDSGSKVKPSKTVFRKRRMRRDLHSDELLLRDLRTR